MMGREDSITEGFINFKNEMKEDFANFRNEISLKLCAQVKYADWSETQNDLDAALTETAASIKWLAEDVPVRMKSRECSSTLVFYVDSPCPGPGHLGGGSLLMAAIRGSVAPRVW